jgi:hypothetical protein
MSIRHFETLETNRKDLKDLKELFHELKRICCLFGMGAPSRGRGPPVPKRPIESPESLRALRFSRFALHALSESREIHPAPFQQPPRFDIMDFLGKPGK